MKRTAILLMLLILVAGCSRKEPSPTKPPRLVLQVVAAEGLNPDGTGRPSPLVLRTYQLKDANSLASAGFFEVWNDDRAVLAGDLLWRHEITMTPGGQETIRTPLAAEAGAIGVVGAYRDVRNSRWQATAPLALDPTDLPKKVRLRVSVGARGLVIEQSE
jgi:type VI secretion system protein VasD